MNVSFLQSKAWQIFQTSLSRQTFLRSGDGWQFLAILERGVGNTRLYCPYGPAAEDEESLQNALSELKKLGRELHVTFLRIEPTNQKFTDSLKKSGWKKISYQRLNPEYSRFVDLTLPEDTLIASMAQPVRNIYRNYHKKGVVITQSHNPPDIEYFLTLIHTVAKRTGLRPHSDAYFRAQAESLLPKRLATLWLASYNDEVIAASIMYDSPDTRIYAHAAASSLQEHRKLNAGSALVAEAIIDAKHQGKSYFDMHGIAPKNSKPNHPWAGFTRFKRSFGGHDVVHAGTWELPLHTLPYWLYRIYQTIRK